MSRSELFEMRRRKTIDELKSVEERQGLHLIAGGRLKEREEAFIRKSFKGLLSYNKSLS
jgi:hypothetical protein